MNGALRTAIEQIRSHESPLLYNFNVTSEIALMAAPTEPQSKRRRLAKLLGVGAFWFFLIKGLLWLIVPALLLWLGISFEW